MPKDTQPPPIKEEDLLDWEILRCANDLDHFERWCIENTVAVSALGRTALDGDQSAIYRWRERGVKGVTAEKRRKLAIYILTHPNGIPGYTKAKTGRKGGRSGAFMPGGQVPTHSTSGTLAGTGNSTACPVPSADLLEEDTFGYVKAKAFKMGKPIAVVLAEMVSLGVRVDRETEYEEEKEQKNGKDSGII